MNKQEVIRQTTEREGFKSQKLVADIMESILDTISLSLQAGNEVVLHGFGKFSVTKRAGRTGRNPRTGKPIKIPPKKFVKFTVQRRLKDAVQG